MAAIVGTVNTAGLNTVQDYVAKSFAGQITRLMPGGSTSLFGLSSLIKPGIALQTEHGYFAKTMLFPSLTLTVAAAAGDTTLTVASTANMVANMILQNTITSENMIVNSVVSPTSVTVTRGLGTMAATAITANTVLMQIGNAFEESSTRPGSLIITPVRITNKTQIFRNTWMLSDTVRATQVIAGAGDGNVAESRQDCAAFHALAIETATLFGQKSEGTRNGQPFRTMDGLLSIIGNLSYYPPSFSTPNVNIAGPTTNFTQLETMLDPVFDQMSDPKSGNVRLLFVGSVGRRVINNIGRLNGTYQLVQQQTEFGLQFASFNTSRGSFRLIEHPLLNTTPAWKRRAICVDPSGFNYAYLAGRQTQQREFNMDGKAVDNGIDACGGTLTTELTLTMTNPPGNAVIHELTAAAVG